MSPLTFRNPPPSQTGGPGGRASSEWLRAAQELRLRSGEWAVIRCGTSASKASGLSKRVKDGEILAFQPRGEFEACYRLDGDTYTVFARHRPPLAAAALAQSKAAPVKAAPKVAARRISKAG